MEAEGGLLRVDLDHRGRDGREAGTQLTLL